MEDVPERVELGQVVRGLWKGEVACVDEEEVFHGAPRDASGVAPGLDEVAFEGVPDAFHELSA